MAATGARACWSSSTAWRFPQPLCRRTPPRSAQGRGLVPHFRGCSGELNRPAPTIPAIPRDRLDSCSALRRWPASHFAAGFPWAQRPAQMGRGGGRPLAVRHRHWRFAPPRLAANGLLMPGLSIILYAPFRQLDSQSATPGAAQFPSLFDPMANRQRVLYHFDDAVDGPARLRGAATITRCSAAATGGGRSRPGAQCRQRSLPPARYPRTRPLAKSAQCPRPHDSHRGFASIRTGCRGDSSHFDPFQVDLDWQPVADSTFFDSDPRPNRERRVNATLPLPKFSRPGDIRSIVRTRSLTADVVRRIRSAACRRRGANRHRRRPATVARPARHWRALMDSICAAGIDTVIDVQRRHPGHLLRRPTNWAAIPAVLGHQQSQPPDYNGLKMVVGGETLRWGRHSGPQSAAAAPTGCVRPKAAAQRRRHRRLHRAHRQRT